MRQTALWLGLLWTGAAFAADPQLMNLVMPDAKVLAGVNATNAVGSPLGQFILTKIGGQIPQNFTAAIGFNPLLDVSEMLFASVADPANPSGLLLARGTFPVDTITASLSGTGGKWQLTTYGGATLLSATSINDTNPNGKVTFAVAFLGNSIAVAGDLASVKAAIDRSTSTNSIDPALATIVNQLSANEDEWLVSSTSVASLLPANAAPGGTATGPAATLLPMLRSIQSFHGGVKFGDNVAFTGEAVASDPQNAAALQAVVKLGVALGGANVPVLQALQVSTNGSTVNLSLSVPEAQIENLVNSAPLAVKPVASRQ
jgi:hypothetical protein